MSDHTTMTLQELRATAIQSRELADLRTQRAEMHDLLKGGVAEKNVLKTEVNELRAQRDELLDYLQMIAKGPHSHPGHLPCDMWCPVELAREAAGKAQGGRDE